MPTTFTFLQIHPNRNEPVPPNGHSVTVQGHGAQARYELLNQLNMYLLEHRGLFERVHWVSDVFAGPRGRGDIIGSDTQDAIEVRGVNLLEGQEPTIVHITHALNAALRHMRVLTAGNPLHSQEFVEHFEEEFSRAISQTYDGPGRIFFFRPLDGMEPGDGYLIAEAGGGIVDQNPALDNDDGGMPLGAGGDDEYEANLNLADQGRGGFNAGQPVQLIPPGGWTRQNVLNAEFDAGRMQRLIEQDRYAADAFARMGDDLEATYLMLQEDRHRITTRSRTVTGLVALGREHIGRGGLNRLPFGESDDGTTSAVRRLLQAEIDKGDTSELKRLIADDKACHIATLRPGRGGGPPPPGVFFGTNPEQASKTVTIRARWRDVCKFHIEESCFFLCMELYYSTNALFRWIRRRLGIMHVPGELYRYASVNGPEYGLQMPRYILDAVNGTSICGFSLEGAVRGCNALALLIAHCCSPVQVFVDRPGNWRYRDYREVVFMSDVALVCQLLSLEMVFLNPDGVVAGQNTLMRGESNRVLGLADTAKLVELQSAELRSDRVPALAYIGRESGQRRLHRRYGSIAVVVSDMFDSVSHCEFVPDFLFAHQLCVARSRLITRKFAVDYPDVKISERVFENVLGMQMEYRAPLADGGEVKRYPMVDAQFGENVLPCSTGFALARLNSDPEWSKAGNIFEMTVVQTNPFANRGYMAKHRDISMGLCANEAGMKTKVLRSYQEMRRWMVLLVSQAAVLRNLVREIAADDANALVLRNGPQDGEVGQVDRDVDAIHVRLNEAVRRCVDRIGTTVKLDMKLMMDHDAVDEVTGDTTLAGEIAFFQLIHWLDYVVHAIKRSGFSDFVVLHGIVPIVDSKRLLRSCVGAFSSLDNIDFRPWHSKKPVHLGFQDIKEFALLFLLPLEIGGERVAPFRITFMVNDSPRPTGLANETVMSQLHYSRMFREYRAANLEQKKKRLGDQRSALTEVPSWILDLPGNEELNGAVRVTKLELAMLVWDARYSADALYMKAIERNIVTDALHGVSKACRETYELFRPLPLWVVGENLEGPPPLGDTAFMRTLDASELTRLWSQRGAHEKKSLKGYVDSVSTVWKSVDHVNFEVLQVTNASCQSPVIPQWTSSEYAKGNCSVEELGACGGLEALTEFDMTFQYGMIMMGGYDGVYRPDVFGQCAAFGAYRNPVIEPMFSAAGESVDGAMGGDFDGLVASYILDLGSVLVCAASLDLAAGAMRYPKRFKSASSWANIRANGDRMVMNAIVIDLCQRCCDDDELEPNDFAGRANVYRYIQERVLGIRFGKFNYPTYLRVGLKRWFMYRLSKVETGNVFEEEHNPLEDEYKDILQTIVQHSGRAAMFGVNTDGEMIRYISHDGRDRGKFNVKPVRTLHLQEDSIAKVVRKLCGAFGDRVELDGDSTVPNLETLDHALGLDRTEVSGEKIVKDLLRKHIGGLAYTTHQGVWMESRSELLQKKFDPVSENMKLKSREVALRYSPAKIRERAGDNRIERQEISSVTPYAFMAYKEMFRDPSMSLMSFLNVEAGNTRGGLHEQRNYVLATSLVFMDAVVAEFDVLRVKVDGFVVPTSQGDRVRQYLKDQLWDNALFVDMVAGATELPVEDVLVHATAPGVDLTPGFGSAFKEHRLNFADPDDKEAFRVGRDLVRTALWSRGTDPIDDPVPRDGVSPTGRVTAEYVRLVGFSQLKAMTTNAASVWNVTSDSEMLVEYTVMRLFPDETWLPELISTQLSEEFLFNLPTWNDAQRRAPGVELHQALWQVVATNPNVRAFYDGFRAYTAHQMWEMANKHSGLQVIGEPGSGKSTRIQMALTFYAAEKQRKLGEDLEQIDRVGDARERKSVYPRFAVAGAMHSIVRPYRPLATNPLIHVTTLHSLFGVGFDPKPASEHPVEHLSRQLAQGQGRSLASLEFLVLEEAEMVDVGSFEELIKVLNARGVCVIMLGDPLQTPPVMARGFDMDGTVAKTVCGMQRYHCDLQYRNVDAMVSQRLNEIAITGHISGYRVLHETAFMRGRYIERSAGSGLAPDPVIGELHGMLQQVTDDLLSPSRRTAITFSVQNYKVMFLIWLEITRRLLMQDDWQPELRLMRTGGPTSSDGKSVVVTSFAGADLVDGQVETDVVQEQDGDAALQPVPVAMDEERDEEGDGPVAAVPRYNHEDVRDFRISQTDVDVSFKRVNKMEMSRVKSARPKQRGNGPKGVAMLTGCMLDFYPGSLWVSTDRFRSKFLHPSVVLRDENDSQQRVASVRVAEDEQRRLGCIIQQQCQYAYVGFELYDVIMENPYQPTAADWRKVARVRGAAWAENAKAMCPETVLSRIRILEFRAEWDNGEDPQGARVWMTEFEASMFLIPSYLVLSTFMVGATLDKLVILQVADVANEKEEGKVPNPAYDSIPRQMDEVEAVMGSYASYSHIGKQLRVAYTRVRNATDCKVIQLDVANFRLWLQYVVKDPMFGSLVRPATRDDEEYPAFIMRELVKNMCHTIDFGMAAIHARWQQDHVQDSRDNATLLTTPYVYMSSERDAVSMNMRVRRDLMQGNTTHDYLYKTTQLTQRDTHFSFPTQLNYRRRRRAQKRPREEEEE